MIYSWPRSSPTSGVPHHADLQDMFLESDRRRQLRDHEVDPADYPANGDDDDDEECGQDEDVWGGGQKKKETAPKRQTNKNTKPPPPPEGGGAPRWRSVPPVHRMTARISIRDEPSISLPPREEKRVHFASPTSSHEVGESSAAGADLYGFVDMVDVPPRCSTSRELDYGITDTWDDLVGAIDEIAPTTLEGVNQRVTDLSTVVEQETTIMYGIMEDARDDRSQLRGRVNLLYRDRPVHRHVMSLRTTVVAQSALISELQSADHKRTEGDFRVVGIRHKRQVQIDYDIEVAEGYQTQIGRVSE
ncbi:hypothetical protein Tco_1212160 [Tanacetum coccineum]